MRMNLKVFRILMIFCIFPKDTEAIKCYQCDSKKDKDCSISNANAKHLKPCPPSYHFCRKAVYTYYFTDSREYLTVRECAKWRHPEGCYRGRYSSDSYQLICECKGGGCNRSARYSLGLCILFCTFCQLIIFFTLSPT